MITIVSILVILAVCYFLFRFWERAYENSRTETEHEEDFDLYDEAVSSQSSQEFDEAAASVKDEPSEGLREIEYEQPPMSYYKQDHNHYADKKVEKTQPIKLPTQRPLNRAETDYTPDLTLPVGGTIFFNQDSGEVKERLDSEVESFRHQADILRDNHDGAFSDSKAANAHQVSNVSVEADKKEQVEAMWDKAIEAHTSSPIGVSSWKEDGADSKPASSSWDSPSSGGKMGTSSWNGGKAEESHGSHSSHSSHDSPSSYVSPSSHNSSGSSHSHSDSGHNSGSSHSHSSHDYGSSSSSSDSGGGSCD